MSLFSKIGSIFHAGEQKVAQAVQHPVQQVVHPVEHMISQGVHPVVAQTIHALQQAQQQVQHPHIQSPHIRIPNIQIPNTPISTRQVGQGLSAASHAISSQSNKLNGTKVGKFANQNLIQPALKTDANVGQVLQGKNPYHGTKRQIAGQIGNDALNMASVIPIGRGAELAAQGTRAVIKQGLKSGAKAGAGYGAAYGTTQSLQDKNATAKTYAKNIGFGLGTGLLTGTALGVGAPVAGAVARGVGREVRAGLPHAKNEKGSINNQPEFLKHYTPSKNPSKDEQFALKYLTENHDKAKADYLARVKKEFGTTNIVGGDDVKHIIPNFGPTKSAAYHEPASAFAKQIYHELLADPKTAGKPVVITAGGTGAGKTTGLMKIKSLKDAAAVVDTNLTDMHGAESRIGAARDSGRPVHIQYVYRDPVEAFKGVINRGKSTGRIVQPATHVETHAGSHETLQQLAQKYGNDPNVNIDMHHNVGKGVLKPLTLDEHKALSYNREELANKIRGALDEAHQNNQITKQEHQAYLGSQVPGLDKTVQPGVSAKPLQEPSQVRQNRFTQGVTSSPEVSPEVQQAVAPQTLNTNRLNISDEAKAEVNSLSAPDEVQNLSNEEVQQIAKNVGIDSRSHTIEQQRAAIAKKLNLRSQIVKLTNEADQALANNDLTARAKLLRRIQELSQTSRSQGSEAARELQARNILADELDTPMQRVFKLLDEAGVNPDAYTEAAAKVNFNDPAAVVTFYREHVPAKFGDWLDVLRYNSMLSSPKTQSVNIGSTIGNVANAPIEKELNAVLDTIHHFATGAPRQYAGGEGASFVKGAVKSLPQAVKDFKNAFNDGLEESAQTDTMKEGRIPIAAPGKNAALDVLQFPMHVLSAFDAGMKALVRGGTMASLDRRAAKGITIKGKPELIANAEAHYRTFNQDLGDKTQGHIYRAMDEVTNHIMALRASKNPALKYPAKFTLPFVRIGVNLLKHGVEHSAVGIVGLPGAANKTQQLSKIIMGTATMGVAGSLLGQNRLTWAKPTSPQQAREFDAAHMQPYSVKFGNTWISFAKLPPILAFNFAMVASLDDTMKYSKLNQSGTDNILTAVSKYGNFLADQSYAKTLGDALAAVKGDQYAVSKLVSNYPQQLVPFRAFGGWLATMTDKTQRQINNDSSFADRQVQLLFQNIPGLREHTPAKLDNEGQPIPATNQIANAVLPTNISTENKAHAANYAGMRQAALDKANKAAQTKATAKAEGTDTKTQSRATAAKKTIAQGVSKQSTDTLINYAKLDSNGKKAFSADPKNKYNLEVAKYENDVKNGKLNDVEKQTKEKSLTKMAITKDYPAEVVDFYNLSNADKNAYFKRDPATAKSLYDQAKQLQAKLTGTGLAAKNVSTTVKTKTAKIGTSKRTKVAKAKIAKPPKLTIRNAKITIKNTKTSHPKVSTAGYMKAKNVSGSSKTPRLYA